MLHLAPLALAFLTLGDPPMEPAGGTSPLDVVVALETALTDAIARAEPSVVAIARVSKSPDGETTAIYHPGQLAPPRNPQEVGAEFIDLTDGNYFALDYGSGVIVGERGEILTAFHVVKGAAQIRVRTPGGLDFDAEVLAADPRSDLAVLVPASGSRIPLKGMKALPLGDAEKLRKGSFLLALGNPFNAARDGQPSASWGILANVARRVEPPTDLKDPMEQQFHHFPMLLQLDSKLNLGMSGGAVVNLKGELVGLTTTAANTAGFDAQAGYAFPINALGRRIIEVLRQGMEVEYGFLGVQLDQNQTNRITTIHALTANEAGLLTGDTIVAVDGTPITNGQTLTLALSAHAAGEPVKLLIQRGGEELIKTVNLMKFPVPGEVIATNRRSPWRGLSIDYTSVLPQGITLADHTHSAIARGAVGVIEVAAGSPADVAGLKKGQIITAVAGKPVRTPADFSQAVSSRSGPITLSTDMGPVTVR